MQYVYCFVKEAERASSFPRGLGGKKVRVVSFAGLGAVVSEGSPEGVGEKVANVLVHQQVVGRALDFSRSVLPCRFGVWVADEVGVLTLLRKNASRLATHLARLENKVEVEIKALLAGQQDSKLPPVKLTAGEKYLCAKREQYHGRAGFSEQARQLSQELNQATAPFWTTVKTEKKPTRQGVQLSLLYLIEREKLDCFQRAYERFRHKASRHKLLYTGPWPPYSFADVTLS